MNVERGKVTTAARESHHPSLITPHPVAAACYSFFLSRKSGEFMRGSAIAVALLALGLMNPAVGQWKPDRPVEIVAPSGPGGTTDRTARVVARILTNHKLVDVP